MIIKSETRKSSPIMDGACSESLQKAHVGWELAHWCPMDIHLNWLGEF